MSSELSEHIEYFYKDGVFIQNQTVLPNKGVGGHPRSKRAAEAEEGRAPQRAGREGPVPRGPF